MSDNPLSMEVIEGDERTIYTVDQPIDNIGVNKWLEGLALAVNQTYSFASNNLFYALIPSYYRTWGWRYCRVACQWLDGYVPSLHAGGVSGIISTRIANKLIVGLTKQIVGEKIIYRIADKKDREALDTLKWVYDWSKKANVKKAIFTGIGYSLGIGTSLIKLNVKNHRDIWWESVRMDNCYYLADFSNEVQEASFVIKTYVDTRDSTKDSSNLCQFFLVEHRFYEESKGKITKNESGYSVIEKKGDKIPKVEFKVFRVSGTSFNDIMSARGQEKGLNWEEIPECIRKMIKKDYSAIRVNEPQKLPFKTIGVEALLNGEQELGIPTASNLGESMIVGIQDDLLTYELASSYLIRDMYNGKGTVYLPKSLSLNDLGYNGVPINNPLNNMPNSAVEMLKGVNPDEQKAIVEQFQLRASEWQLIKENCLRNIAVKWGMSPKILASFLAVGNAQITATQIDSEDDMSIAFIYHTRSYFIEALNRLLETTLNFYGKPSNIELSFASPSLINKDRILNRVMQKLEAGLIDLDDGIRELNPDLDEEAIQDKVERAKAQQQENLMNALNEFNDEGSFGDLDGTTKVS